MNAASSSLSRPIAVLSVAGSDSGGGAGIQADLRTFAAHGLLGCTAITALTAQNTRGVTGVVSVAPEFVAAQIAAVMEDLPVRAAKTGMLGDAGVIRAVARAWRAHAGVALVVDPVMVATSGDSLLAGADAALSAFREQLLPVASVVTPNLHEAAALLGREHITDLAEAAEALAPLAPRAAFLIKGGHAETARARDYLRLADGRGVWLDAPRISTTATHGTGCTLSAAIAARLALGDEIEAATRAAKRYLTGALQAALPIGAGHGPVDHLWALAQRGPSAD